MGIKIIRPDLEKNGVLTTKDVRYNMLVIRDSRGKDLYEMNKNAIENGKVMLESHYFVSKDGKVYYVRPEGTRTDLGTEIYDRYVLLIDVEGMFEYEELDAVQGNALLSLCKMLLDKYPSLNNTDIICLYELIKDKYSPGPAFPINYLNELVRSGNSFYVKVKAKVESQSRMTPYPDRYSWKSRKLFYTKPYLQGNDVLTLKFKLAEIGANIQTVNTFFDEECLDAVNAFRKTLGLPLTGVMTIDLMEELDEILNKRIDYSSSGELLKRLIEVRTPYMEGSDVEFVQNVLSYLEIYEGPINSKYTTDTAKAVGEFQIRNELERTEKVDNITWELLKAVKYIQFTRMLYITQPLMQGNDVEMVQKQLLALGYDVETTTVYDIKTESAVKEFQRDHGLRSDGIVNLGTFNTLFGLKKR